MLYKTGNSEKLLTKIFENSSCSVDKCRLRGKLFTELYTKFTTLCIKY